MSVPLSTMDRALPAPLVSNHTPATYARQRLRLGIAGVGVSVALSALWLLLLLTQIVSFAPSTRLIELPLGATLGPPLSAAASATVLVLLVFAAHALVLVGVEYVGGALVVRQRLSAAGWLRRWVRGVLGYATVLAIGTFVMALAASLAGYAGLVSAVIGVGIGLLAAQGVLARVFAPLSIEPADESLREQLLAGGIRADCVRIVDAEDEAFVGGWVGLLKPQLWIPRRWTAPSHGRLLEVQLVRRHAQFISGARRRGIWRAAAWPALGVALFAPLLPWAYTDSAFWLALPAVSTLWTFVAVLLLPSLSRPVVYSADAAAARRLGVEAVIASISTLNAWQDDEPERSPGVEFIFHPVPSRRNRERALQRQTRTVYGGGHQQTRLTLFASLAAGGLLGRVVHCNIGRPSLWAVYPGD